MVELIRAAWKEGDELKLMDRYYYTGFDLADGILRMGNLTNLTFVEWSSFNEFILAEGVRQFSVRIDSGGTVTIRRL